MATSGVQSGDAVKTLRGSIDRNDHQGDVGIAEGFTRFSKYHAREVMVRALDGSWAAWFWVSDVEVSR